jgi:hypothetical protein
MLKLRAQDRFLLGQEVNSQGKVATLVSDRPGCRLREDGLGAQGAGVVANLVWSAAGATSRRSTTPSTTPPRVRDPAALGARRTTVFSAIVLSPRRLRTRRARGFVVTWA